MNKLLHFNLANLQQDLDSETYLNVLAAVAPKHPNSVLLALNQYLAIDNNRYKAKKELDDLIKVMLPNLIEVSKSYIRNSLVNKVKITDLNETNSQEYVQLWEEIRKLFEYTKSNDIFFLAFQREAPVFFVNSLLSYVTTNLHTISFEKLDEFLDEHVNVVYEKRYYIVEREHTEEYNDKVVKVASLNNYNMIIDHNTECEYHYLLYNNKILFENENVPALNTEKRERAILYYKIIESVLVNNNLLNNKTYNLLSPEKIIKHDSKKTASLRYFLNNVSASFGKYTSYFNTYEKLLLNPLVLTISVGKSEIEYIKNKGIEGFLNNSKIHKANIPQLRENILKISRILLDEYSKVRMYISNETWEWETALKLLEIGEVLKCYTPDSFSFGNVKEKEIDSKKIIENVYKYVERYLKNNEVLNNSNSSYSKNLSYLLLNYYTKEVPFSDETLKKLPLLNNVYVAPVIKTNKNKLKI